MFLKDQPRRSKAYRTRNDHVRMFSFIHQRRVHIFRMRWRPKTRYPMLFMSWSKGIFVRFNTQLKQMQPTSSCIFSDPSCMPSFESVLIVASSVAMFETGACDHSFIVAVTEMTWTLSKCWSVGCCQIKLCEIWSDGMPRVIVVLVVMDIKILTMWCLFFVLDFSSSSTIRHLTIKLEEDIYPQHYR